jgi:membrane protease YdiL (CAAX protease family)
VVAEANFDASIFARVLTGVAPVVVMLAWGLVRGARASVWATMATCLGALGILSLLTGEVRAGERPPVPVAVLLGLGAGVALYLATAVFLSLMRGWSMLGRHTAELYARRGGRSVAAAVVLAAGISAGGEELLWRGVFQGVAAGALGTVAGAVVAWAIYLVANAVSGSVPVVLAAVVGGGVWTALAVWTGGVAAGLACHAVWTALMVALPPLPTEDRT